MELMVFIIAFYGGWPKGLVWQLVVMLCHIVPAPTPPEPLNIAQLCA